MTVGLVRPECQHKCPRVPGSWRHRTVTLLKLANAWLRAELKTYDDFRKLPDCGKLNRYLNTRRAT